MTPTAPNSTGQGPEDRGAAPLAGLTVVDLGQVLATPFATYLLGTLGADIIKIEPPAGEWLRQLGPQAFATQNAGKRSVVVDLRSPGGAEVVRRIAEQADVFVEGFAPGTAEAMGLGWETISARNPRIVYGSLSAFGSTGPYGGRPGFDHVVQAVSGIMPATGFEGQPPTKVGAPFLDYGGGLLLAFGLLAGILEQRRTDRAVRLDVSMLDAGLLFNAGALARAANLGVDPPRTGNDAFSGAVASGAFPTADGLLMVAANKARHFRTLCDLLDLADLAEDPALAGPAADPDRVADARRRMGERLATASAEHWERMLNQAGVPAARVRSMTEVVDEGHPAARGVVQPAPGSGEAPVLVPGSGVVIDGAMAGPSGPVPELGAATVEILTRFGFSTAEIDALLADGTVGHG
jgi:crotonobetainyl-CoA:carnitine CoA-transferase CaiB-like acyl-CoA transferase